MGGRFTDLEEAITKQISIDLTTLDNVPDEPTENIEEDYQEEDDFQEEQSFQPSIDPIERRRRILILQFYLNEFPDTLVVYKDLNFENMSDQGLLDIRQEFDFIIGCKNSVGITITAFKKSIETLEHVCVNFTPLKVQGLSTLTQDKDLIDDVKHWSLQNMQLIQIKPEYRILYRVLSGFH